MSKGFNLDSAYVSWMERQKKKQHLNDLRKLKRQLEKANLRKVNNDTKNNNSRR